MATLSGTRVGRSGTTYLRLDVPLDAAGGSPVAPATFQRAWRSFRDVARRSFPQARLVLGVHAGRDTPAQLTPYWPGDDAVDVVGVRARVASPQQAAVVENLTDPRGLAAWLGFATTRGKPVGVPDWGIDTEATSADGVRYVRWIQAALAANAAAPGQSSAGRVVYAAAHPS
jgi:beta-mannanase